MEPAATTPRPLVQEKFSMEKGVIGGVTVLTLHGTVHNAFGGRKVAESIRSKKIVVSMREVRRFASWGMTQWMDFLRVCADRDLYLIECSTYAVGQINLVTGLLGHAKLVSFYASYRCAGCSEEFQDLFLIPRDRNVIRDLPASVHVCTTCGGQARLEDYPAAFFEQIAERAAFDVDDEVLSLLRTQFKHELEPDLNRFRAHRAARNGYTYLRLQGNLGRLPHDVLTRASEGTTVVDLGSGITLDPAELAPWRTYVQTALTKVKSLQLINCPPGFLEAAVAPEDLRDKLKIRSFALTYECVQCEAAVAVMVDVADHLEYLVKGTAPDVACPTCHSPLSSVLTADQIVFLRSLPARDRDPALDKFLTKALSEPVEKLENCLAISARKPPKPSAGVSRGLYLLLAACALLIGALSVAAIELWQRGDTVRAVALQTAAVPAPTPTFTRPDWILFDVPATGYCHDMINRLMCVGISSFRTSRDDAVTEANDAALDELVNTVGLKVVDPVFRETISGYSDARGKALGALQASDLNRTGKAYADAAAVVRKARRRVVEILQASGGPAVPNQRADWYWEEYAGPKGAPNETLVFVRYDVSLDALRALVERYSTTTSVLGNSAMTAFPGVAWQFDDFTGGALLTKLSKPFEAAGIAPQSIVMAVGDQRVADATAFARRFGESARTPGETQLTVRSAASTQPVRVKH